MPDEPSNYSFTALLDKQPQSIATAVVAGLNLLVITHTLQWSAEAVGSANVFLVAALSLFVRGKSVAAGDVQEKVDAAAKVATAETKADIGAFLAAQEPTLPPPPPPPPPAPKAARGRVAKS